MSRVSLAALLGALALLALPCQAQNEAVLAQGEATSLDTWVNLYVGKQARNESSEVFVTPFNAKWYDAYVASVTYGRNYYNSSRWVALGYEVGVAVKFGDETFGELNGLLTASYRPFPWDRYVETTLTIGVGASIASTVAELENDMRDQGNESANFLPHLMLEWEFGLAGEKDRDHREWSMIYRIHHRSGAYGTFADDGSSSDFLSLGIKRRW